MHSFMGKSEEQASKFGASELPPKTLKTMNRTAMGTCLPTEALRVALRSHLLLKQRVPTQEEAASMANESRPSTVEPIPKEVLTAVTDQLIDEAQGIVDLSQNKSLPGFVWQVGDDHKGRFLLIEVAAVRRLSLPCAQCGKDTTARCSACSLVHYCGVECQKAHRNAHVPLCAVEGSAERRSARERQLKDILAKFPPMILSDRSTTKKQGAGVRCTRVQKSA